MIVFPNCKINLGLHITGKRADGFHDIETIFFPVHFCDALEVISTKNTTSTFTTTGILVTDKEEDNLCYKAYHLLQKDFPQLPSIQLHLHKAIPSGAGLGGGSADAAFTLQLLNTKFNLGLSTIQLLHYAQQLGSDCPFFLLNKPCFATGRGEILEEIKIDLSTYKIVLVNPHIHINTAWAFSQITPVVSKKSIRAIIQQPISTWKDELNNDFEAVAFTAHPSIQKIKENLYQQGALYAAMSGSGSTVYGIFKKDTPLSLSYNEDYLIKIIE